MSAEEISRLLIKYPGRIPVIVSGLDLAKRKFLCPPNNTIGQFLAAIAPHLASGTGSRETLFLLTSDGILPSMSSTIREVYDSSGEDNILSLVLRKENTFGCIRRHRA